MKIILFFIIFWGIIFPFNKAISCDFRGLNAESSQTLQQAVDYLQTSSLHPERALQALLLKAQDIQHIRRSIYDCGWCANSLYLGKFYSQDVVIKVAHRAHVSGNNKAFIRKALSDMNRAQKVVPEFYGILSNSELRRLFPTDPEINKEDSNLEAIVMEDLKHGHNLKDFDYLPRFFFDISEEVIVSQIQQFIQLANRLSIKISDAQPYLMPSGKLYFIDFDAYEYLPNQDVTEINQKTLDWWLNTRNYIRNQYGR